MTAKEYLESIQKFEGRINHRKDQLKEIESAIHSTGAVRYDQTKVQTSYHDRIGDNVAKLIDLQNEVKNMIIQYEAYKNKIISQIEQVNDPLYEGILYRRYVKYWTLTDIADQMNYSFYYISRKHTAALAEFERVFLAESKT